MIAPWRLAALAAFLGLAGCGSSRSAEPPSLTGVTVSPPAVTIATALQQSLAATASYTDGRDTSITGGAQWSSSAPGLARVSAGVVTGVAPGTAEISASFDGLTGTSQVTVSPTPPPLAGISVIPADVSLAVGDHQPLAVTGSYLGGATGDLTSQASWLSSAPGIADVNGGVVSGLAVGDAEITATVSGLVDSSRVSVTPTNEPAGYTRLTEHYFNTISNTDGAGIGSWSNSNDFSIAQDPTAPRSPPNVAQFTYPAGFQAGSAPGHIEFELPANLTELYVSFWMKLSPEFEGQSSETNKVLFVWILDHPAVFLSNQGSGTADPLIPTVRYQESFDPRAYFRQNVGSQQVMTRGQWRKWEVLLIANTPGQSNGVIRYWIDGQRVGEYTDVRFRDTLDSWQYVFLQPIWGGIGGTVTSTQYLWVDHLVISGKP